MHYRRLLTAALFLLAPALYAAELGGHLSATLEADNNRGKARDLATDLLIDD